MAEAVRVAVLASGGGSNLGALIEAARGDFPARIALVVANNPDAGALDRARRAGIPAVAVDHRPHGGDRAAHEAAIQAELDDHAIGLVCLAGYMRVLTPFLVERWRGRMLNMHPSLLPAFPGLRTHARALAAGVALHGCSVHLVTAVLDDGPILAQAAVPVLAGDTETTLAARVLAQEHLAYPLALRLLAGGGRTGIGALPADAALLNATPPFMLQGEVAPPSTLPGNERGLPP